MSKNNQIENNQKLKSLKIQNTDTQLSERIDGVTSQVFPDSDIIKKTDVSNIEADNAKEVIDVNENLNNEEPVKVASMFKFKWPKKNKPKDDNTITGLQEKQEDILKTKVEEKKLFKKEGNQYVFDDLDEKQILSLEKTIGELTGEVSKVDTAKLFKNKTFNVNDFGNTVYKAFKNEIDKFKNGPTTVEEVLNMASKYGLNEVYTHILKAPKGTVLPKEIIAAGLIQTRVLGLHLDTLMQKIAKGTASEADMIATQQTFKLYAALMGKVNAAMSEWGTTGAIFRHIDLEKVPMQDLDIMMSKLTDGMTPENWKHFASHFLQLDLHQKSVFIKETWGKKLGDVWAEVWVNTRLMSPITHTVNIVGNTTFNALRIVEYGIAAGINKVPGLSHRDGVMFSEVWAMMASMNKGTKLALGNGWKVMKNGNPITSKTTKMDLRKNKSLTAENLLPEKYMNSWLGMGIDGIGTMFRLPGRFLLAEDEAMKGIIFHMELDRLATKRYNIAIADGVEPEEAMKLYKTTLANPDSKVVKEIKEAMLEGTFQKKLPPGIFSDAQRFLNIPAMKMFVPFYKTIMNIFFESSSRNPALAFFMPSVRKALSGADGPAARQLALAKLASGTALLTTFGSMAYGSTPGQDIMITGMAPLNKAEREAFYRKGFLPYSICVLDKSTGMYSSTSYARFDPVSSLLAISADTMYYLSRPDQFADNTFSENAVNVATSAMAAIFPYISSQPFATGLSDLGVIFQPGYGNDDGMNNRAVNMLIRKITESTIGIGINPTGTFGAYLQRMSDPQLYETMITSAQAEGGIWFGWGSRENNDGDIPGWIKAFYKEINKARLNSPFFNHELPPRLNLWGQEMEGPEQNVFSPIRVLHERDNIVDDWLVQNNFGLSMPKASISTIDLTAEEYNQYITFINMRDPSTGLDMLGEMRKIILDPEFKAHSKKGEQLDALKRVLAVRKTTAAKMMKAKYKHLAAAIKDLDDRIALTGKN